MDDGDEDGGWRGGRGRRRRGEEKRLREREMESGKVVDERGGGQEYPMAVVCDTS